MELKESNLEMDDSVRKGIRASPKDIQEKSMPCTSNFEDHSFYNVEDHTEDHCGGVDSAVPSKKEFEDDEVDIMECTSFDDKNEIGLSECNDGTDGYSSSFSGTVSEHESITALNDQEADSMISADTSQPLWVRKKKLTDHWKRFIQPITWRCKWIELKIKEFQNQARMYDKEVEKSCQAKELESENLKLEEFGIKALPPLPCYTQKNRLRKRKRRKRIEDTSDVAPYALNHNLFSYYGSEQVLVLVCFWSCLMFICHYLSMFLIFFIECRKSFADIALNDNTRNLDKRNKIRKEETVFCEETPPLEFREGDTYLEQILLKIEAAKSEARNLKTRVDKVLSENPTCNLPGSADGFTSSEQQKPQLVIKNEDEKPVISEDKPVKAVSVSSHHDTPEEDETKDILLSEILASKRREGKAIVAGKKIQNTEQTPFEEGPSRTARKRTPRNREVMKEESNPKRHRVSREKPKSNTTMASRFKLPNRKRNRGKRRSGSAGLRRRS